MNERNFYVYALLREGGEPFYIGASRDIKARSQNHLYDKRKHVGGAKPRLKIINNKEGALED